MVTTVNVKEPSTPLRPFNNQPQVLFNSPNSPQPFSNAPSQPTSQNFISTATTTTAVRPAFDQTPYSSQSQQIVQQPQPNYDTPASPQSISVTSQAEFIQPQQPGFSSQPNQPSFIPQQPSSQSRFSQPQTSAFQSPFAPNQLGKCAVRDTQGLPRGYAQNEAAFGEFPWQAMILRESTKSILCGGAVIEKNLVATAASCVDGLRTHDVLIKAGEWKLGSNEEPKPFQTVRVKQITMHPAYQPTNLQSDLALLHLENDLKYDQHIGAICLDESELDLIGSNEECVTSGWGKEIIKYHVAGSLPHSLAITPLSETECQASLNSYDSNTSVCGRAEGNPCDVDTGSALACTRGNGSYLLKGIYSTNSGCGNNQLMSFTKMDINFLRNAAGGALKSLQPTITTSTNYNYSQQLKSAANQPVYTSSTSNAHAQSYLPPQL